MTDDDLVPDIPPFLKRGSDNKASFMTMANTQVAEEDTNQKINGVLRPEKAKSAKVAKPKADKPAAKKVADKKPAKATKPAAKKAAAKPSKGADKAKVAKPKAETAKKDKWGFRDGSAKSMAVALYAAKGGATLEEVKTAVGSVQLNVLNGLEAQGHTVIRKKEVREGQRPVTRYFLKANKA